MHLGRHSQVSRLRSLRSKLPPRFPRCWHFNRRAPRRKKAPGLSGLSLMSAPQTPPTPQQKNNRRGALIFLGAVVLIVAVIVIAGSYFDSQPEVQGETRHVAPPQASDSSRANGGAASGDTGQQSSGTPR